VAIETKVIFKKYKVLLAICLLLCVFVLFFLVKPDSPRQNEVVEHARILSANGTWIAKTVLEITSAPLVSAASYEVRVVRNSNLGANKEFIVYSVEASGFWDVKIIWEGDDVLTITDSAQNIANAYKAQQPGIKVQFAKY
jgi:hypothetical protein